MKESLIEQGWEMYYECMTCKGFKQFFRHPDKPGYEIQVKVKAQTFSILQNNYIIAGPFWAYQHEEKIRQFIR